MKLRQITTITLLLTVFSSAQAVAQDTSFQVVAYKGMRHVFPENSLMGFTNAVEKGVRSLYLPVVVSSENTLFVSSHPWLSSRLCTGIQGEKIFDEREETYNLYRWRDVEISACDCGSKNDKRFPDQIKSPTGKPSLWEVMEACQQNSAKDSDTVQYYIELVSDEDRYHHYQPPPQKYAQIVVDFVESRKLSKQVFICSKDENLLNALYRLNASLKLGYAPDNILGLRYNLKKLEFTPEFYAPDYLFINKKLPKKCREAGIRLLPKIVNQATDATRWQEFGASGVLTDRPVELMHALDARD